MTHPVKLPRKLIEVALPLNAINEAAGKEKSIRHGHPSTLHLWWARRPLAAARAVLFAQMVNDPGYERHLQRGYKREKAAAERERLFGILERLVLWENTNNPDVLAEAQAEIRKSWVETCKLNANHPLAAELFNPDELPAFHDPFAGGGALPLEAQRLGLEAYASDLNPVAVLINKAMIELPPRFAGRPPVAPPPKGSKQTQLTDEDWSGARGLAEDVRRYGAWMKEEAQKRIGHLYPKVTITAAMAAERPDLQGLVGKELTVIAWLWARTVPSPNPAFAGKMVPLASTFLLSKKEGKAAWVEPNVVGERIICHVRAGKNAPVNAEAGTKADGRGANFKCLLSDTPISGDYIKDMGQQGRMREQLMAMVLDGPKGRIYLSPTEEQERTARSVHVERKPMGPVPARLTGGTCYIYGLTDWNHLFTDRQLLALNTFSELVAEAVQQAEADALNAGWANEGLGPEQGGTGAKAYAEAVGTYLGIALSRLTDICNALCRWEVTKTQVRNLFGRQAIPMIWDFAENNVFADAAGDYSISLSNLLKALERLPASGSGSVLMLDAQRQELSTNKVISTDPPYYDNIGYADLSDFFYVWLRKGLRPIYPQLFGTLSTPKAEELVATPYRHGGKEAAETFFMDGMTEAIHNLVERAHPAFPVTIYYAFKQSDTKDDKTANSGWETFLQAVINAGFGITGTWPMRTELGNRMIGSGTNALASSIVLVCRKRAAEAPTVSRREFLRELNATLPEALAEMTRGGINSPVAPVDLSQAIIGPGMAIFSQYAAVLESDGTPMTVHTALTLINRFLAEDDLDPESQFCLHWFEQQGWSEGPYGSADVLCRSKGTSVETLKQAGVVTSGGGRVGLVKWTDYPDGWHPERDPRIPAWEALHHLIRALDQHGEEAAGTLLASLATRAEGMRTLAYRLYTLCERQGWAEDARAYNTIITAWPAIETMSTKAPRPRNAQIDLEL
ncbi:MAG: DUF1156 domain-containing protein [Flavobacteriales bacterium]|nr:DUF1156 domain-containing protein [Flavobacteriales bacterium]